MRQRKPALATHQRAFKTGRERLDLQGIVRVVSLDPEMPPSLEIEVEICNLRTLEINDRVQLTPEILEMEGLDVAIVGLGLEQCFTRISQGTQLTIQRAAESVHEKRP